MAKIKVVPEAVNWFQDACRRTHARAKLVEIDQHWDVYEVVGSCIPDAEYVTLSVSQNMLANGMQITYEWRVVDG